MRRRVIQYWLRHAKKLATAAKETNEPAPIQLSSIEKVQKVDPQGLIEGSQRIQSAPAASVTLKTIHSATIATEYNRNPDDMLETQSVISYASTLFDVEGNRVELPSPPAMAFKNPEFLCPYCGIVCPSRCAQPRAYRNHFLQDIQPYICTYHNCSDEFRMYATRHAWLEHERLVHRRAWQCFQHKSSIYQSKNDLKDHLELLHSNVTEPQIQDLLALSESSIVDLREKCPICLISGQFLREKNKPSSSPTEKEMHNHIAFHLEKFATFSVSRGIPSGEADDSSEADCQSGIANGLRSEISVASESLSFQSIMHSEISSIDDRESSEDSEFNKEQLQVPEPSEMEWDKNHTDKIAHSASQALEFYYQGRDKEAAVLLVKTLKLREKTQGLEHPDTSSNMAQLAMVLCMIGKYGKAEELFRLTLRVSDKTLVPENLIAINSRFEPASVLKELEKLDDIVFFSPGWNVQRKSRVIMEHPDFFTIMHDLCYVLYKQKKFEEAFSISQRMLELTEDHSNLENNRIPIMVQLVLILAKQGKFGEAETKYRQAVELMVKEMKLDHTFAIDNIINLESVLSQLKGVEFEYRDMVETNKCETGLKEPRTITKMAEMAVMLSQQRMLKETEILIQQLKDKDLGLEHPETKNSMIQLATALGQRGKFEEAEILLLQVLSMREKELGLNLPRNRLFLTPALKTQGKYKEAEVLIRQTLALNEEQLGLEDPDTIANMAHLIKVMHLQGNFVGAEALLRKRLELCERVLGPEQPGTITTMSHLASTLESQEKFEEAELIYRQTLELRKKVLGLEHPYTIPSMDDLASVLRKQGKYEESKEIYRQARGIQAHW
ncbi:MAG: hypothetical protein M1829_005234 [Trizodia sp. TS-e1964]|nr:MAG: hypothetical protein M1829_005234 [Trizodia sp. TS-e1964]